MSLNATLKLSWLVLWTIAFSCTLWMGHALAEESELAAKIDRYQLTEGWSVAAQGPVHLREKRVEATYVLEVQDLGTLEGQNVLQVHIVEAAVQAEVPAQKREGAYDSRTDSDEFSVEHHELVRPMALHGQTLKFIFAPSGELTQIEGTSEVMRKLDDIYDADLRGSEQDLYTRDLERERLSTEILKRNWAHLFHTFWAKDVEEQTNAHVTFIACIPSESWMLPIEISMNRNISRTNQSSGAMQIEEQANLREAAKVEATIGDATWSYEPVSATQATTIGVGPHGRVENFNSHRTAVLTTTLTLSQQIPIQMTIDHWMRLQQLP